MKLFKEIGRNARVDWIVILLLSFVAAVVLAIGGFNLYNAVKKGDWQVSDPVTAVPTSKFNDKAISSFMTALDARGVASDSARGGYKGVGDPSI